MAFGFDDAIMLALAGGNILSGFLGDDDIPPELQEAYDKLKLRSDVGLPGSIESSMISDVNRQAYAGQARGSMALASRGMGNSSAADSLLASTEQARISGITDVYRLDEQVKMQAEQALLGVSGNIASIREARRTARGESIGKGLGMLTDPDLLYSLGLGEEPVDPFETLSNNMARENRGNAREADFNSMLDNANMWKALAAMPDGEEKNLLIELFKSLRK